MKRFEGLSQTEIEEILDDPEGNQLTQTEIGFLGEVLIGLRIKAKLPKSPRWKATIAYKVADAENPLVDTYEFSEFDELGEFIEGGPSFYAISSIHIEWADPKKLISIEASLEA